MGPRYAYGGLIAVLAVGYFLSTTQQVVGTILIGLNLHGKPALYSIPVAIAGVLAGIVGMRTFGCTLSGAALMVVVPLAIGNGVIPMVYACRKLHVSVRQFAYRAFIAPGVRAVPFALCLLAANRIFTGHPFYAIAVGGAAGAALTAPLYWSYLRAGLHLDKTGGDERSPSELQAASN